MLHSLDRKSSTNLAQRLEMLRAQDLAALEQDLDGLPERAADSRPFCVSFVLHLTCRELQLDLTACEQMGSSVWPTGRVII